MRSFQLPGSSPSVNQWFYVLSMIFSNIPTLVTSSYNLTYPTSSLYSEWLTRRFPRMGAVCFRQLSGSIGGGYYDNSDIQFSLVQSLSHVWLFATPWATACQASLSIMNSQARSNSCPLSHRCHPTISSSVIPFSSYLQSFPASGSFSMSKFFISNGQNIGASASASVFPMILGTNKNKDSDNGSHDRQKCFPPRILRSEPLIS